MKYDFQKIEKKWQKIWEEKKPWRAVDDDEKKKFYSLIEFPYPSGDGLHVGHVRSNTAMDIISRKRRMEGCNVLYPIGWDAFGLPTENYAIKTGIAPQGATKKNTDNFRRQLKALGFSFDWEREINTTDPNYYKWTQWLFLKFFEHGLAYKEKSTINWCPRCKIGLANEEAAGGVCDRCGGPVEKREKEQWMLKITAYADKLLAGLKNVDFLPEIKRQQENWIGRSEGRTIQFSIFNSQFSISVFTTRPDTLPGATYVVVSPEHALIEKLSSQIKNIKEVENYLVEASKKSEQERQENKEKTGVELKDVQAVHPLSREKISVWVADYVLAHYGTGAIMAVPAHDERDREFAQKFGLPISDAPLLPKSQWLGEPKVNYRLRDWVFSRQRYWGEPIPLINCGRCGWVAVPEKDLPVVLPKIKNYQPRDDGQSPLASDKDWVNVECPKCGGLAQRETDTMPNWAGSSWYFMRYSDAHNDSQFASTDKLKYWLPVDWYNGGMEHVTLHLLYSRFWNIFLHDLGLVPYPEPYKKRTAHGLVLGEGGVKMSKSKGNVINPDDIIKEYGADSLRLYEMFMGPFADAIPWDQKGIVGMHRFLNRLYNLFKKQNCKFENLNYKQIPKTNSKIQKLLHQTIKKVSEDIEAMRFNTAISALMILINECEEISDDFIKIIFPFAPHLAQEFWEQLGNKTLLDAETWPEWDEKFIVEEDFDLVVQINGKVRGTVKARVGISQNEAETLAKSQDLAQKWLAGKKIKNTVFVKDRLINLIV